MYKMEIKKYEKWKDFSDETKKDLLKRAKSGDELALGKLWNSILGAIWKTNIRFQYNSGGLTVEDLVQESYSPFFKSVMDFDESKKVGFLTFALGNIMRNTPRVISNKGTSVRIPLHLTEKNHLIKKVLNELEYETVDNDNIKEISKITNMTEKQIKNVINTFKVEPLLIKVDEISSIPEEKNVSDETLDRIDLLKNGLTTAEFTMMRHFLGVGTIQLTKKIILEKYKISRSTFDKVRYKSMVILKKELKIEGEQNES